MPPKQHREIAMQFGGRMPKNAVVIEPLGNGQGVHWLSDNAGLKARIREAIRERERKKRLARFHAEHDQSDHGNWADQWPDDTVQVWHGTPASRLDGIIKEGIVTGKFNNWTFTPEGEMEKEVFVGRHPMTAANFGAEAAWRAGEDEFAVVEARIPKTEPMAKDTRTPVNAWTVAKVKHEWLVGAKIYKRSQRLKSGTLAAPVEEIRIHENEYVTVYIPMPAAYARQLVKKFHLPGEHDQLDHGNWADGEKSNVSQLPEKVRKRFLDFENTIADHTDQEFAAIAWSKEKPGGKVAAPTSVTYHVGEKDNVRFTEKEMIELIEDGNAILTHNHPTDISSYASVIGLSIPDIRMAMQANLKEIRAVVRHASGDYVFSMSRGSGEWPNNQWPPPNAIDEFLWGETTPDSKPFVDKYNKLYSAAKSRSGPGKDTKSMSLALSHARMKLLAEYMNTKFKTKLVYRMVKISDKNVRA